MANWNLQNTTIGSLGKRTTGGVDPTLTPKTGGVKTSQPQTGGIKSSTGIQSQPWHTLLGTQPWAPGVSGGVKPVTAGAPNVEGPGGLPNVDGGNGPTGPEGGPIEPPPEVPAPGPGPVNPNLPTCKEGETETSLDSNGKNIPNGYECVTPAEANRRLALYVGIPPEQLNVNPPTGGSTPTGGGSPTPNAGGPAPAPTPFTPSGAPEFVPPKFTEQPGFVAPEFNWTKEFEGPKWNYTDKFNTPTFNFTDKLDLPDFVWNEEFRAPSYEEALNDPGYQFRLSEGMKALENNAAARGSLRTGATLKGLSDYAGRSASQEYENVFDRYKTGYDTRFGTAKDVYGADYKEQFDEYQSAMDAELARYNAAFEGEKARYDRGFDAYQAGYGADYARSADQYNKAFEAFMADFAATYQGKSDEWERSFSAAKEKFDQQFASEQARHAAQMTEWQTNEANRQRQKELEDEFKRQQWFWNNPSATTIFQGGLK